MTVADKTYVIHVTRGAELLRADRVDEARAELEQALKLRPSDVRIMNLLGLTYFRLGSYPEAEGIYSELVKRSPKDASLRLNLGLVHLRRGEVDDAIRELTRARELDPSQLRTMGYLGLAFARKGRYALARDAFHAAGQDELAKEMDQQLALEMKASEEEEAGRPRPRRHTAAGIRAVEAAAVPSATASMPAISVAVPAIHTAITAPVPPVEPAAFASPAPTVPLKPVASAAPAGDQPEGLPAFLRKRLIRPEGKDAAMEIGAGHALVLRINSRGRVFARTFGVIITGGQLTFEPVQRRTRARQTGEPFGLGEQAISLVSGTGHLVALPRGGQFAALMLDGESIYLREDLVFAFEERLSWENGHVPGSNGGIPIVQLRGDGCVAMRSERPVLAIEVAGDRLLRVAAPALAGWSGGVVPRIAGGDPPLVECAGEGSILIEEYRP